MLGRLLQRTSTYPVSTSTGLFREPATRKGLRYRTNLPRRHLSTKFYLVSNAEYFFELKQVRQLENQSNHFIKPENDQSENT